MDYRDEVRRILETGGAPMTSREIHAAMNAVLDLTLDRMRRDGELIAIDRTGGGQNMYGLSKTYRKRTVPLMSSERAILDVMIDHGGTMTAAEIRIALNRGDAGRVNGDLQRMRVNGIIKYDRQTQEWSVVV